MKKSLKLFTRIGLGMLVGTIAIGSAVGIAEGVKNNNYQVQRNVQMTKNFQGVNLFALNTQTQATKSLFNQVKEILQSFQSNWENFHNFKSNLRSVVNSKMVTYKKFKQFLKSYGLKQVTYSQYVALRRAFWHETGFKELLNTRFTNQTPKNTISQQQNIPAYEIVNTLNQIVGAINSWTIGINAPMNFQWLTVQQIQNPNNSNYENGFNAMLSLAINNYTLNNPDSSLTQNIINYLSTGNFLDNIEFDYSTMNINSQGVSANLQISIDGQTYTSTVSTYTQYGEYVVPPQYAPNPNAPSNTNPETTSVKMDQILQGMENNLGNTAHDLRIQWKVLAGISAAIGAGLGIMSFFSCGTSAIAAGIVMGILTTVCSTMSALISGVSSAAGYIYNFLNQDMGTTASVVSTLSSTKIMLQNAYTQITGSIDKMSPYFGIVGVQHVLNVLNSAKTQIESLIVQVDNQAWQLQNVNDSANA